VSAVTVTGAGPCAGLFVELLRRGAERGLASQEAALQSPQPLWPLWEVLRDHLNNVRTIEFFALANHRKAIRAEVVSYSAKYRERQLDVLSRVLIGVVERQIRELEGERWLDHPALAHLDEMSRPATSS
jgi:hypothetical protein